MSSQPGALRASTAVAEPSPSKVPATVRALFYVRGAADPGLLPRLIEPVARLGHVPARIHATREAGDGSELTVDLRLRGVPQRAAELVECCLRAVVGVRQVICVIEAE